MIKVSSLVLALSVLASRWLVSEAWAAERPALPPLQMVGHSLADWLSRVPPWALVIAGAVILALLAYLFRARIDREKKSAARSSSVFGERSRQELTLEATDFEVFQGLVEDLNAIWHAHDIDALAQVASADMAARLTARLQAQLAHDKGWAVHELQVLRSDLVDAWHEGALDHAQMNLRLSTLESAPDEIPRRFVSREIWTFERPLGGNWRIAGVRPVE